MFHKQQCQVHIKFTKFKTLWPVFLHIYQYCFKTCYPILTSMTTFMVEHAQQLFIVPPKLVSRINREKKCKKQSEKLGYLERSTQVAGVEEITRRRSSQGCVSLARQEVGLFSSAHHHHHHHHHHQRQIQCAFIVPQWP